MMLSAGELKLEIDMKRDPVGRVQHHRKSHPIRDQIKLDDLWLETF